MQTESCRLEVKNLQVCSERSRVLVSSFSWTHPAGGVAWLVGENGTGKSSLLRVLVGAQRAHRGQTRWLGGHVRLRYYAPMMSVPADIRVHDWVNFVESVQAGVTDDPAIHALRPRSALPHRRFGELSNGEAKRLLLWGLLRPLEGPLVLDEPYEHLSREAKQTLTVVLRTIATHGVVVVATNQDIPLVGRDQLLTLDGSEVQIGPPV